ncbi:MAG: hypothetical protein WCH61_04735 [bacterium]
MITTPQTRVVWLVVLALLAVYFKAGTPIQAGNVLPVERATPNFVSGYLALLLINEVPFPGESNYTSLEDSKSAMAQILWVINCRRLHIPPGYNQEYVANIKSADILDIITAHGQCDGFYRAGNGAAVVAPRVAKRFQYLYGVASKNGKTGKFADLLNYGQGLANAYVKGGIDEADRFASLEVIKRVVVTGHAYAWMTDKDYYRPGGNFVFIPDSLSGSLGGNRFYTLKKKSDAK